MRELGCDAGVVQVESDVCGLKELSANERSNAVRQNVPPT